MDFLDPKKRRKHAVRLMIGYVLVAIAILMAATILVYYAYGFGVTRNGEVVQKGLLFVSSQPSGAQLTVNGARKNNTNTKLALPAATYLINIKKEGYHDWSRRVTVDGSAVDHIVYPILFPAKIESTGVKVYETAPALSTQSPDRRWLLVQPAGTDGVFDIYDLNKNQKEVGVSEQGRVPAALLTPSAALAQWKVAEWSTDNKHVLLQRTYTASGANQIEYILFDRENPQESRNISREITVPGAEISLRDKKPDVFYVFNRSAGSLSVARLDNQTPTETLTGVLAFKPHGDDKILYATSTDAAEGKVNIMLRDGDITYQLRSVEASEAYLLDLARYDGNWYVALGSQAEDRVYIYKDPVQQIKTSKDERARPVHVLRSTAPTYVGFSPNTQFVLLQNGSNIRIYDADHVKSFSYDLPYPLEAPQSRVEWMDGSHLTYVSGGKQVVFDYDGTNKHELSGALPQYGGSFDREYKYLYGFVSRDDGQPGVSLTSTPLRLPDDM